MIKEINIEDCKPIIEYYFSDEINNNSLENIYTKALAYIEDTIKGIIVFDYIYDRIEITYIVVLEQYRNSGIASKMLDYLIKKYNCSITLEVKSNNIEAIKLYEKYDFKKVSVRKSYYGQLDAWLMFRK